MDAPVVVIGGGATGLSVTRDLAMRGIDVVCVERGTLNSGTSGRSHRVLHSGARYAVRDPASAADCAQENAILRDIASACIRDTGGHLVAVKESELEYLDRAIDACRTVGIDCERIEAEDLRSESPVVGEVTGAARVPDGVLDAARLTAATAADAEHHGAHIRTQAPVTDLSVEAGRVSSVEIDASETLDAAHVVIAAGAWSGQLASLAGVDVEMAPTRGAMVVMDNPGVETVLNRAREPSDGDIIVPHPETVVLGTTSEPIEDPDGFPTDHSEVDRVVRAAADMVPDLDDMTVHRPYWGVRPLLGEGSRETSRGMALLDHADRDGVSGLTTVVGGKLTTCRLMGERVGEHVADRLGIAAPANTATEPLPGGDELPDLVDQYETRGPATVD